MKFITATLLFVLINSFAYATLEKKQMKIRVAAPGGTVDETTIYFDLGISSIYTATEDGPKVYSNIPTAPSIYSLTSDNVFCSTNGYSRLTASEEISLGVKTDTTGTYVFTSSMLSNFDPTTIIQLEDRQENIFTELRMNFYSVQLADSQNINGRFFLHVSRAVDISSVTAGCDNNDGMLQLEQDNSITWTSSSLFDSIGNTMGSFINVTGTYNFANLPEGDYNLVMTFKTYVTSKIFHVNGNYVVAHIQPTSITASVNEEIIFNTTTHNVSDYQWDLGDGAQIGGIANPPYTYSEPGIYKVLLKCTNAAGCENFDSVTVTISAFNGVTDATDNSRKIWAAAQTITVVLNEEIKQGTELKIFNLLGQPIYTSSITGLTNVITLNETPAGYYFVSVQNNQVVSAKRVFLGK